MVTNNTSRPPTNHARASSLLMAGVATAILTSACALPLDQRETIAPMLTGRMALPPQEARAVLIGLEWVDPASIRVLGEVTAPSGGRGEEVTAYVESGVALVNGERIVTPTSAFRVALRPADAHQIAERERLMAEMEGVSEVGRAIAAEAQVPHRAESAAGVERWEFQFDTPLGEAEVERLIRAHLGGEIPEQLEIAMILEDGKRTIRFTGTGTLPEADGERVNALLRDLQQR